MWQQKQQSVGLYIWCSNEYFKPQDIVGLSENKLHNQINYWVFMVMREHVTHYNRVAHWCIFSFWTTVELYGTEEYDMSGFGYTDKTC